MLHSLPLALCKSPTRLNKHQSGGAWILRSSQRGLTPMQASQVVHIYCQCLQICNSSELHPLEAVNALTPAGLFQTGYLTAGSMCWAEGEPEWRPLQHIPDLQDVLGLPVAAQPAANEGESDTLACCLALGRCNLLMFFCKHAVPDMAGQAATSPCLTWVQ